MSTHLRPKIGQSRYEEQYPELFAELPNDAARRQVAATLDDSRLEGKHHTRANVADLISLHLGQLSRAEYVSRARQRHREQPRNR